MAGRDVLQVHLDEFRQVLGQAGDFDVIHDVRDGRAAKFHRLRLVRIDKVERYLDADFAVRVDTLKVDMLDLLLERMHLVVAQ